MATTYVQRLISMIPNQGKKGARDRELETRFVDAVGRQIRSPYQARHPVGTVLGHLHELWERIQVRTTDDPIVDGVPIEGGIAVMTIMPDQPFIMDTLLHVLRSEGARTYVGTLNAVVSIGRDDAGRVKTVDDPHDPTESVVRAEAEDIDPSRLEDVIAKLRTHLGFAQMMVHDFSSMTDLVEQAAFTFARKADRMGDKADDFRETAAFLRWLIADNFVFMGAIAPGQRLGLARSKAWDTTRIEGWEPSDQPGVEVRKGAQESPAHRAGRLDEIRVDLPPSGGEEGATLLLQGLFTRRGVTQPSRHVPLLRRALARILRSQDSKPGSFRYKNIANLFDSLPTEFLFTTPTEEIGRMIDQMLEAVHEQRASVHVTQSDQGDVTFVLASMPKECWSDRLRVEIEQVVRAATGASYADHGVFVNRHDTVLQHFFLTGSHELANKDIEALQDRIAEMATTWEDRILEALVERLGKRRADELIDRYGSAFDENYVSTANTAETLKDLELLDQLSETVPLVVDFFEDEEKRVNLRIYHLQELLLSDVLPILDNFGLIIIDQWSHVVRPVDAPPRHIATFRIQGVWGLDASQIIARETLLVEGLSAVFSKLVPDDVLNRILLRANIPWQAVDMVRAYIGYARQLGLRFTITAIQEILLAQPHLVTLLWEYFQVRFDPDLPEAKREAAIAKAREAFEDAVRGVPDHDQDVTFRTLYNLVDSTLRTNFYRTDRKGYYVSFKIDCKSVRMMPMPRMMYEIWVHHREMEGIHHRGGPIARGGLRWSDREDFRREVLDLVTTQMVKNVLIVPEGAKGGFYIKRAIRDPKERRRYADWIYQTFIRALLDLTDNIVKGKVAHPPRVVRHDGDDPYLVVAADKGTAHLSDTANGVSKEYGFWLGDAFASGGSVGYDHKECGITARGGWVTAKRHFLEMGVNPYEDEFTCVGIGDPSGDVFGNGVIETPKMRLVAAFNHLHVFIDPNPDAPTSYEERVRLFKEVKGWEHYNKELISTGGGIYDRRAKSIPLSPEAKQLLGVLQDELPVDAVIRLILRLNVDLLWNGGIGTYVKASTQSHLDAGDPTNDQLRVNASELRCKVIGEGGNLGMTQAARLEYALGGGRLNTDAIDNSGGVDMSDHEVNLKILLNPIVARGEITEEERNELLRTWLDEVCHFVLANNDQHGRQLSLDQVRSFRDPMSFSPIIDYATRMSGRSRADLQLPAEDTLKRRAVARQGITRPELAVLSGYIKMHVFKAMMADQHEQVDGFDQWVVDYFPAAVRERWPDDIKGHMLHRAIGMTVILTHVMADGGAKTFPLLADLTAASPVAIADTWLRISDKVGIEPLRKQLNSSEAALEHQYRSWTYITDGITALAALWLSPGERPATDEDVEHMNEVLSKMQRIWGAVTEEAFQARVDRYVRRKMPQPLAHRTALMGQLAMAWEIARLPWPGDTKVSQAIIHYVAVGEASRILPALRSIEARQCDGPWDPVAMGILRYRYGLLLRELVLSVDAGPHVRLGVDRLAQKLGRGPLRELQVEMDRILGDQPDLATLLVAQERVRALIARQQGQAKGKKKAKAVAKRAEPKRAKAKKGNNGVARTPAK